MPKAKVCAFCKFFSPDGGGPPGWGVCRRYPPLRDGWGWPRVSDGDWCGDFRPGPMYYRDGGRGIGERVKGRKGEGARGRKGIKKDEEVK